MRVTRAVAALVGVLVVAGCSSTHRSTAPTTVTAPPPTSSTVPATTPATTTPSPPATAPPASGPATITRATCPTGGLAISVGPPNGSAGALHYLVAFRNTSGSACTLTGIPGVSFFDGAGNQIGPPARRGTRGTAQLVAMAPGATTQAELDVTDPGIPPCAGGVTVAHVRVYPPGNTQAALVAPPGQMSVCSSPNTANYIASTVGPVGAAP